MTTRIYRVTAKRPDGPKPRLVKASSQAQALRHVVEDTLTVELASQDDLVALVATGVKVEAVNSEDASPSTN